MHMTHKEVLTVDIAYNVEHILLCKAVYDTFSNAHHAPPDAIVSQVPNDRLKWGRLTGEIAFSVL